MPKKKRKLIGARVIKTGIAVLLTAWICFLFELPAVFAVITAIVSMEPTASASIRKGLIRLPASAIGAAISVLFVSFFGGSPFTYAFAAALTIMICHRLKLNDGALVAAITAVAMIPGIHDHFVLTFLTRLGTTTLGLTVATVVNIVILPPKFTPTIEQKLNSLPLLCSSVLKESVNKLLQNNKKSKPSTTYEQLRQRAEEIVRLANFQKQEWKYHRGSMIEQRHFIFLEKQLMHFQRIILHLGNLQYIQETANFTNDEKKFIENLTNSISAILEDQSFNIPRNHYCYIDELDTYFKEDTVIEGQSKYHHHFSTKTILFYELLSLHDTLEEMEELMKKIQHPLP